MLKSKKLYVYGVIVLVILVAIVSFFIGKNSATVEVPEETTVATEEVVTEPTTVEDRFFNRNNRFGNGDGNGNRNEGMKMYTEVGKSASTSFHNICVESVNVDSSFGNDTITCNFTLEKKVDASTYEELDELFKLYVDGELVEIDEDDSSLEEGIIVYSAEKDWEKFEIHFQSSPRSRRIVVYEYENPNK